MHESNSIGAIYQWDLPPTTGTWKVDLTQCLEHLLPICKKDSNINICKETGICKILTFIPSVM